MLTSVLIANRGEIARRVIGTCRRLGIRSIAVYSAPDADLPFVAEADEAVELETSSPRDAYRDAGALLAAAARTGAQAIHPGYGFLSENPGFAEKVIAAGHVWIGPDPDVIGLMGDKIAARNYVAGLGVPVSPGSDGPLRDAAAALALARGIGYPVMVKAAAGGGGMGIAVAYDAAQLSEAFGQVQGFSQRLFGDPRVYVERYYARARHIEVQLLGQSDGSVVALGLRNCSVQRRRQKLLEETPCSFRDPGLAGRILDAGTRIGGAVGYKSAGTIECLVTEDDEPEFVFLEMNTRLQVEHPVTEQTFGIDLVEQQLRAASGLMPEEPLASLRQQGHSIEMRVNAEDPVRFLPGPGTITGWHEPSGPGIRVDSGYRAGNTVSPLYDSLMAKLIVHGDSRQAAIETARAALAEFRVAGPKVNLDFFRRLFEFPAFVENTHTTGIVAEMTQKQPGQGLRPGRT
jgi:acetyl-CoA carboxylase, biotin carboxylase subunit